MAGTKSIILAAGGSGGHIFPSIAVAESLAKNRDNKIFFVASKRDLDKRILRKIIHKSYFLSVNPMPRKKFTLKWLIFAAKFIGDTFLSMFLILRLRPSAVIGFGGYSSGAMVRSAALFNIPVMIHEQNIVPGRANLLLSRSADKIAVTFKESSKHFTPINGKIFYSGNPLRNESISKNPDEAVKFFNIKRDKKTVLIMGGSQGARFLNRISMDAALILSEKFMDKIQFIHITGSEDYENARSFYEKNNIKGVVMVFLEKINYAYSVCDMAISRSGASSIFELAWYAKPMILIPYPERQNSQRKNAEYFALKGAAALFEENSLSADMLAEEILKILFNEAKSSEMAASSSRLSVPNSAELISGEILKLMETARR